MNAAWLPQAPRVLPPGRGARAGSSASDLRVLIVDDEPPFRQAARGLLERRGYGVVGEADCAHKAIDSVQSLKPDALLLDVDLPDMDGFALAKQLTRAHRGLAVLLTSNDVEDSYYARARKSGASGFVPKSLLPRADLGRFWPSRRSRRERRRHR